MVYSWTKPGFPWNSSKTSTSKFPKLTYTDKNAILRDLAINRYARIQVFGIASSSAYSYFWELYR